MPTTIQTRKPVTDLTVQDLETFRIWQYATDEEHISGRDETWVRPVPSNKVPKSAYSQIVAADFTTVIGRKLAGFMLVTTAPKVTDIHPGAVLIGKYLVLPTVDREVAIRENDTWSIRDREALLEVLATEEKRVFPLNFKLKCLDCRREIIPARYYSLAVYGL